MRYVDFVQRVCSKETFISIMEELKDQHKYIDAFNEVLFEYTKAQIFPPDCSTACLSLLHNLFQDQEELISHFIFVLNFGTNIDEDIVIQIGGHRIVLNSSSDLYDALLLNLQLQEETNGTR